LESGSPSYNFHAGEVLLFNKPLTWTSFQLTNKVKWLLKNHSSLVVDGNKVKPKVGHAGTLDPLATGLLIICTGKKTKEIEKYQGKEKEYTGTIYLGATTPCFDLEKEIDARYPTEHITEEMIYEAADKFTGVQLQTPPIFSAVWVNGQRAYDLARKGETPEIKAKEIEIMSFEITRIAIPEVDFKVVCTKGTYIRSLARDFGAYLNSGAHLTALCRTRIGEHALDEALSLEAFIKLMEVK
jgi:tRNA pseudouridine55 synthase